MKGLNIRPKIIELLEENIYQLYDTGFGNDFLDMRAKAQVKRKNRQIDFIKIKKISCINRHRPQGEKAVHKMEENICKAHDQRLIFRIYRQVLKLNNTKQLDLKVGKGF